MIEKVVEGIKKELIGKYRDKNLINKIVEDPDVGEQFYKEAVEIGDNPVERYRFIYLSIISKIFHSKSEEIKKIKDSFLLQFEDMNFVLGLSFMISTNLNKYDTTYYIAKNFELVDRKLMNSIVELIKSLIQRKDYEKTLNILNKYDKFIINKKPIQNELKKLFVKSMTFKDDNISRDYTESFKINKIFELPKDVTFQKAMEEYNFNINVKKYYKAATISKNFVLGKSATWKAASEAFRQEMGRFKNNLNKGVYKNWKKINIDDHFHNAKKILTEYDLYNVATMSKSSVEYTYARTIAEISYGMFSELLDEKNFKDNDLMAKTYLAIRLIKDYNLNNDHLFLHIYDKVIEHSGKLINNIDAAIIDYNTAVEYLEILKIFKALNIMDYTKTDDVAKKIFIFIVEKKEIQQALNLYMLFSFRFDKIIKELRDIIYDWAENNDFETIILFLEKFPIKGTIIKDKKFMEKVNHYYEKNAKENKHLKCLTIAETFEFNKSKYIDSVKSLIEYNISIKKILEAKRLMKKYDIKKAGVNKRVKEQYYEMLKSDKESAAKIREVFGLSIFDVGFLKWLLYELMGLKME